ncbi:MAG TPA: hypothetical protein VMT64_12535 [Candidatus Binataceae bacterium]|nr:hypothetical protein [Candidatus Binataceae bacterium]
MKKTLTALTAALILTGTFAGAALAQPGPYGITGGEVTRFDQGYLDEHPEVAQQLARNPGLIDNSVFRANHPGLDTYLAYHPGVRTELQQHPYRFMTDEHRLDRVENRGVRPFYGHPVARNSWKCR